MYKMLEVKFLKKEVKLSDKNQNKVTKINRNTFRLSNTSAQENIKHLIENKLMFKGFEYVGFSFYGDKYFLILKKQ